MGQKILFEQIPPELIGAHRVYIDRLTQERRQKPEETPIGFFSLEQLQTHMEIGDSVGLEYASMWVDETREDLKEKGRGSVSLEVLIAKTAAFWRESQIKGRSPEAQA